MEPQATSAYSSDSQNVSNPGNDTVTPASSQISQTGYKVDPNTEIMTDNLTDLDAASSTTSVKPGNWIEVLAETYVCAECENSNELVVNTPDGLTKLTRDLILSDLKMYPAKKIYTSCSLCGMEYSFKEFEGRLYLEPSDREK